MRMPSFLLRSLGSAGVMAMVAASGADLQVIEFAESPEEPVDPATIAWPVMVVLPKFDVSLGTLTGIRFTFTSSVTADVGFENRQEGASNTLDYSLPLTARYLIPTAVAATEQDFTLSGSSGPLGSYDGVTDFGGSSGVSLSLSPAGAVSHLDVDPADFSAYTRSAVPGTFDVSVYLGRPATEVIGDGAKAYSFVEVVAGQTHVQVTYAYSTGEEVPEAGGWLAAAGLSAAALVRRLRKRPQAR